MSERLGYVLYWAFCGVAALAVGLAIFILTQPPAPNKSFGISFLLIVAALSWLVGRAIRYVLAGR